jgi:hypothetical protein
MKSLVSAAIGLARQAAVQAASGQSYPAKPMLVVHPSIPVKTIKGVIALARKNPGKLNFASGGVGNTMHLGAAASSGSPCR